MAIDFEVEPEFQKLLDWTKDFVTNKVSKVDLLWPHDTYKAVSYTHLTLPTILRV